MPHTATVAATGARGRSAGLGQFDRYILTQLIVLFGFFSLVLISVYWIEAAVDLFDSLIADGQNLGVFLEFTALALPQIMMLVLPISAFVATLYIFNRMIGESELVVMQTAGLSAWRLMRPVLLFGLFLAAMVGVLANVLAPAARSQFIDRSAEVQEDLTGRFLRAGEFIHPTAGLTVYIREITELGEFRDLFLQDRLPGRGRDDLYRDDRASGAVRGRAAAGDVRRHGAVARPGNGAAFDRDLRRFHL
jgi:lipopolysaccharide export system permease protein